MCSDLHGCRCIGSTSWEYRDRCFDVNGHVFGTLVGS